MFDYLKRMRDVPLAASAFEEPDEAPQAPELPAIYTPPGPSIGSTFMVVPSTAWHLLAWPLAALRKAAHWVRWRLAPRGQALGWLSQDTLKAMGGRLAGGYAVLVALLAFFGVSKDSRALDALVSHNPHVTLLVLALLGASIVAGVTASAAAAQTEIVVIAIWRWIAMLGAVVLLTVLVTPSLSTSGTESWGWGPMWERARAHWVDALVLGGLWVLAVLISSTRQMSLAATLVISSVVLLALGLFSAITTVVEYKQLASEPTITADASTSAAGGTTVAVHIVDRSLSVDDHLLVAVLASREEPSKVEPTSDGVATGRDELAFTRIEPSAGDDIDRTMTVPVPPFIYKQAVVVFCLGADDCTHAMLLAGAEGNQVAAVTLPEASRPGAAVTGTLEQTGTASAVTISSTVHATNSYHLLMQYRMLCGTSTEVARGSVPAGADGTAVLTGAATRTACPKGKRGQPPFLLQARLCPDTKCENVDWLELARRVV
jgi:hypothetical protein